MAEVDYQAFEVIYSDLNRIGFRVIKKGEVLHEFRSVEEVTKDLIDYLSNHRNARLSFEKPSEFDSDNITGIKGSDFKYIAKSLEDTFKKQLVLVSFPE